MGSMEPSNRAAALSAIHSLEVLLERSRAAARSVEKACDLPVVILSDRINHIQASLEAIKGALAGRAMSEDGR
jgi:hypothetical protein